METRIKQSKELLWVTGIVFLAILILTIFVRAGMLAGRLEKAGTPPAALIQLAPASVLKEYARQGRFLSVHSDPVNPPDSINVYGFKMGCEYILTAQTLPIEEESAWYTGPVCLLHGTLDRIVPISCSERYHQLYRHSEFHRIRGTEHLFLFHRRKVRRLILDFLRQTLDTSCRSVQK